MQRKKERKRCALLYARPDFWFYSDLLGGSNILLEKDFFSLIFSSETIELFVGEKKKDFEKILKTESREGEKRETFPKRWELIPGIYWAHITPSYLGL